jgi:hypothetical protein
MDDSLDMALRDRFNRRRAAEAMPEMAAADRPTKQDRLGDKTWARIVSQLEQKEGK